VSLHIAISGDFMQGFFAHAAKELHKLAKKFTCSLECNDTLKRAMYALVINARFTRHSEQLQSLPCQRV